jgi:F-type H+-transporting ATPase subunit epsilon
MQLDILTPARTLFSGEADSVTLPGVSGLFTVLDNHAPMIASLAGGGVVTYTKGSEKTTVEIDGGFARVLNNVVSVCIETHLAQDANPVEEDNEKQ